MTIENIKIGEKFILNDNSYLRIDMDLNNMTVFADFSNLVCVLDLSTYRVVCFHKSTEVTNT
jgi:hypothetical protein